MDFSARVAVRYEKKHHDATILSDPVGERVLEVVEHRTLEASQELLDKAFTKQQQSQVKRMAIDLWPAFISVAAEKLPQAAIHHDKFHLIKYLNEAIDKVRRREVKDHAELKNSRYVLLKNEGNLTARQRIKFAEIRAVKVEVSRVWEARENFKEVFQNAPNNP